MANRLVPWKEVVVEFSRAMAKLPLKQQRALAYDMQSANGFPASRRERDHYIKTGQPLHIA